MVRDRSFGKWFFYNMEIKNVKLVRGILQKKVCPAIRDYILSFLHVYIRDWHLNPPTFQNKPVMLPPAPKWYYPAPSEVEVKATEGGSQFRIKLYHQSLFYPPFSTYFAEWEKIAGSVAANKLVEYYSFDVKHFLMRSPVPSFEEPASGDIWERQADQRHAKLLLSHGNDVNEEFEKDIQLSKENVQRKKIKQSKEAALARLKKSKIKPIT